MRDFLSRRRFIRYAATGTVLGYGGSQGAVISSPPGGYTIYVTPHSHMDIEWYWTYDKTQVLAIGILRQALEMLRKDPGFAFTQDQRMALEPFWNSLSRSDKDFLRSMIQEGRFEVATGTIVQPDISAPDFESLTRQFLLAKPWLETTLGAHIVTCWNIDTYGHTIQMPQLCRQAGLRYFVFMRDVLPSLQASVKSPFHWQGVDGTRILAYWLSGTYDEVDPKDPDRTLKKFVQHNVDGNDKIMVLWGHDMYFPNQSSKQIESLVRKAGAEIGIHIKSVIVTTPRRYFEEVEKSGIPLPVYHHDFNPPLLMEDLRGLYGESSDGKIAERHSEDALESAEKLSSITSFYGKRYPSNKLRTAWWNVLFNQDHDILPGSHNDAVEREMMSRYHGAIQTAQAVLSDSIYHLSREIDTSGGGDYPLLVYNALSFPRTELVRYEPLFKQRAVTNFRILHQQGESVPFRLIDASRWSGGKDGPISMAVLEFVARHVPSTGYRLYRIQSIGGSAEVPQWHPVSNEITSHFFFLRVNPETGLISSLVDRRSNRELLDTQDYEGNDLILEEEHNPNTEGPIHFTGREIRSAHFRPQSIMELNDDVGTRIRIERLFLGGRLTQEIDVYRELPRVDFTTKISGFSGHDGILTAVFPLRFSGTLTNYYETNNTVTQRPDGIYYGQTFAGVEGAKRGVAILNRGMGGYQIQKGAVRHILLRSITNFKGYYCPQAAQAGSHTFAYSLYPYEGDGINSSLTRQAHSLNSPVHVIATDAHKGSLPPEYSFLSVEAGHFEVTALKKSEKGNDFILRGYETHGKSEGIRLHLRLPLRDARFADLLEQAGRPVSVYDGAIEFKCRPFEFVTLRLSTSA
ncbi:MAG: glycosyl hydrolase-related protein [Bryobacteraceae bacterium]